MSHCLHPVKNKNTPGVTSHQTKVVIHIKEQNMTNEDVHTKLHM